MLTTDMFAMIYTGENDYSLAELTRSRPVSAVPIGGRYRLIDIILSNMVHSGVRTVGIIAQKNYHSLMDHVGSGKEWDLNRKQDGLFILPPYSNTDSSGSYKGLIDALRGNAEFLRRNKERYVLVTQSHTVFNFDYNELLKFHIESGADISMLYDRPSQYRENAGIDRAYLHIGPSGQVMDIEVSPMSPRFFNVQMDMVIMETNLLLRLVDECCAQGRYDFKRDILMKHVRDLRIFAYPYHGYVARVDSVANYFTFNMDLLKQEVRDEIFSAARPVYTKVKDEVPARYGQGARAVNSLVADGCIIEGTVENCVLFRGVRIGRGSVVRNSVLMQGVEVRENAELNSVIVDKDSVIGRERRIVGTPNYPVVIGKRISI